MKLVSTLALFLALISPAPAAVEGSADSAYESLRARRFERPPPGDVKTTWHCRWHSMTR